MSQLPAVIVTDEQRAFFREHGFLHLAHVLDEAICQTLDPRVNAVAGGVSKPWGGEWLAEWNLPRTDLHTRHGIHTHDSAWAGVTSGLLRDIAGQLLGRPVVIDHTTVVSKPARTGQPFPWHQDLAYYGTAGAMNMLVYLDDAPIEAGPIRFIDGSHLLGLRPHDRHAKAYLREVDESRIVEVPALRGDIVCSDILTIHGSRPNLSGNPRRAVRVGYRPA